MLAAICFPDARAHRRLMKRPRAPAARAQSIIISGVDIGAFTLHMMGAAA